MAMHFFSIFKKKITHGRFESYFNNIIKFEIINTLTEHMFLYTT